MVHSRRDEHVERPKTSAGRPRQAVSLSPKHVWQHACHDHRSHIVLIASKSCKMLAVLLAV